jgi:hypothetical protein
VRQFAVLVLSLVVVGLAHAAWAGGSSGVAASAARTMPAGNAPTGSASGFNVTVTWAAASFAGGGAISGYTVRRFDALGNPTAAGSGCAGIVGPTSCTESAVPTGTWRYAVTPAIASWRGGESAQSPGVLVPGL